MVPDAISERCCAFLDDHPSGEPSELFQEECASHSCRPILHFLPRLRRWFVDAVLLCPEVVGAVRSLLGPGFGLPILISNHRGQCPAPPQAWHHV